MKGILSPSWIPSTTGGASDLYSQGPPNNVLFGEMWIMYLVNAVMKSRYFGNIIEIGFGADVMRRVNMKRKTLMNPFTSAVIHELWRLKNYELEIEFDGGNLEDSTGEVIIANCRYFGSGMLASKFSDPVDGLLDLHLIRRISRLNMMRKFSKLRDGSYLDLKEVRNQSSTFFGIKGDRAPIEGDGEVFGFTPCKISAVPKSLKIMISKTSPVRKISAKTLK